MIAFESMPFEKPSNLRSHSHSIVYIVLLPFRSLKICVKGARLADLKTKTNSTTIEFIRKKFVCRQIRVNLISSVNSNGKLSALRHNELHLMSIP